MAMARTVILVLLIVVVTVAAGVFPARAEKLFPSDESVHVPYFAVFKQKLMAAIKSRDAAFVYALITPDIEIGFGRVGNGAGAFRKVFNLADRNDRFWSDLERIVKLGGAWDSEGGIVWFPYVARKFPPTYGESLDHGAITASNVNVRAEPNMRATVVGNLTFDIVKIVGQSGEWTKVYTEDAITGYVLTRYVHSPTWLRAGFKIINGRWRMPYFVSGE